MITLNETKTALTYLKNLGIELTNDQTATWHDFLTYALPELDFPTLKEATIKTALNHKPGWKLTAIDLKEQASKLINQRITDWENKYGPITNYAPAENYTGWLKSARAEIRQTGKLAQAPHKAGKHPTQPSTPTHP